MIEIVSATRLPAAGFAEASALGASLARLTCDRRWRATVAFENRAGLPAVYNSRLLAEDSPEYLVFAHDDLWLEDAWFVDRVIEGLSRFDVIGLAGNRRRLPGQPAWAFADDRLQWDEPLHLSGRVAHGDRPFGRLTVYGESPAPCELLDGVLLGVRKSVLREHGVAFDPRFDFHFYDLDLCRSARERGLSVGTWPIAATHQSGGAFGTSSWRAGLDRYRDKWMN